MGYNWIYKRNNTTIKDKLLLELKLVYNTSKNFSNRSLTLLYSEAKLLARQKKKIEHYYTKEQILLVL